ncbi:hypothetical protein TNIN_379981 [Trichonephila inaurata madagascariensis]|uniref:Uncharacterized protein n=1 Tax=Trichonephila inaurata madagascariensis TaxID=2747483 RepID=A0A8X7C7F5_9ARAC|nr:hypothetical protein TNIN_379981 [Trichonephila inaurata madagascariensis]
MKFFTPTQVPQNQRTTRSYRLCRVSSKTSSKRRTEPESFGNSPDIHNTKLNSTGFKTPLKVKLTSTDVWEDHLTSLDAEDGSLWGTAKEFRRKANPISTLNSPTGTALGDTNKTELIPQSLESQF